MQNIFHIAQTQDSDPCSLFLHRQESESVSDSISGNVNEPLHTQLCKIPHGFLVKDRVNEIIISTKENCATSLSISDSVPVLTNSPKKYCCCNIGEPHMSKYLSSLEMGMISATEVLPSMSEMSKMVKGLKISTD